MNGLAVGRGPWSLLPGAVIAAAVAAALLLAPGAPSEVRVSGVLDLLAGAAYLALAGITAIELTVWRRRRGFSHFGAAWLAMALTCGPHHLFHGAATLVTGRPVHWAATAATVLSLPPTLIALWLRLEAFFGGRGDRFITGSPWWLAASVLAWAAALGALAVVVLTDGATSGAGHAIHGTHYLGSTTVEPSWARLPNAVLVVAYALVGWFILRTQMVRRPALRGYSLTGIALGAVFPTCAASHALMAATHPAHTMTLVIDVLAVPGALYFLWVVRRLHRQQSADWNRRPLVGRAGRTRRAAPWAPADPVGRPS